MKPARDIHVLLLAAGTSTRMRTQNKLLLNFLGKPIVHHVCEQILLSQIGPLTVVIGHEAEKIKQALSGLDICFCHNPDFEAGQMSSVRAGYRSLESASAGVMVALGDMPALLHEDYKMLSQAFFQQDGNLIIVPFHNAVRGNPIIIPQRFAGKIISGSLNAGCRNLVASHQHDVYRLEVQNSAHITDIDTQSEFETAIQNLTTAMEPLNAT